MRLFIGFTTPSEPLRTIQYSFSFSGISLTNAFHCTLKFLGEVDESRIQTIISLLHSVHFQPFTLAYGQLGVFPSKDHAKVLWAGLAPLEKPQQLHEGIDHALSSFFSSEKNFIPHVTLGRIKFLQDRTSFNKALEMTVVPSISFIVDHFSLFQSELAHTGSLYTILETFPAR